MSTPVDQLAPNPLQQLSALGQSPWLDFIERDLLEHGGLATLVETDGLKGLTSNPAIFKQAISGSAAYAASLRALAGRELSAQDVYEALAIEDIRQAADIIAPVYADSKAVDGYVSLEVSPHLAFDTAATIAEARDLWARVDRPNLMIKVPGTREGVPAIETLIGDGINVNTTLLFSRDYYHQVAEAYLAGLEKRITAGQDIARIAGVASFFVSRVDTVVDKQLDAIGSDSALALRGQAGVANARLAYQDYLKLISGERWQRLADQGAMPQRLLWASTSMKNPAYRDVLYVEELIGPDTVNTIPPVTMDAFREHGIAEVRLTRDVDAAQATLAELDKIGVDLTQVTDGLLVDGVQLFVDAFDELLTAVAEAYAQA